MTLHCYKATSSFCTLLLLSIASTTVSAGTTLEAVASNNATTGDYIKTATGCQVYRPPLSYGNRVTWSGDCQSGYAQGKGVAKWYNGKQYTSRYQGTFVDGKLQGKGRIDWEIITNCDFDYYEGELKDSDVMGRGIFHYTDGNIYDGIFTPRGQPAKAVFTWGVGSDYHSDRYEGEFLNGKRQGRGIYTWENIASGQERSTRANIVTAFITDLASIPNLMALAMRAHGKKINVQAMVKYFSQMVRFIKGNGKIT